jgi:phospholipase C
MESVLSHKTGTQIRETNISPWRRAICGDLSSAFRPIGDRADAQLGEDSPKEQDDSLTFIERDNYLADIHRAQFKNAPETFTPLNEEQLSTIRSEKRHPLMPAQEPGTRPACPIPYELACDGSLNTDHTAFVIAFEANTNRFADQSAGAPFIAYVDTLSGMLVKHYAVDAGGHVEDSFDLGQFADGLYSVRVHGPNGFYRHWTGDKNDPSIEMNVEEVCDPQDNSICKLGFRLRTESNSEVIAVQIHDNAYGNPSQEISLSSQQEIQTEIDLKASHNWYDLTVAAPSYPKYKRIYAGHVENGRWTTSDPQMA